VLEQIEAEHDNLRAALGHALETSDADTGLRLGSALWRFWQLQGHFREGNRWLTALLALPGAAVHSSVRARGLGALGSMEYWQSDVESARAKYEESLSIYREIGDREGIAEQLYNLAYAAAVQKDYPRARALYRESADLYAALGQPVGANLSEDGLAMVAYLDHDPAEAKVLAEKVAAFFRSAGEKFGLANALGTLGHSYLDLGDIPSAVKYLKESIDVFQELGDLSGTIWGLETFAEMALKIRPEPRRAAVLLGAAASFKEEIGASAPNELTGFPDFDEELRKVMAPDEIEAARSEGSVMTVEEAIAFAFDVDY
ncbi:MAG: tetratricopeptide repeat protein, partial [Actinomycetota bacterium]